MKTRAIIMSLAAFLAAQAYGYEWCHYQKNGQKCHTVAVTGGKYCKKHFASAQKVSKSKLYVMKWAMEDWRKYRKGREWKGNYNGYDITISKDGQMTISEEQRLDEIYGNNAQSTVLPNKEIYIDRSTKDNRRLLAAEQEMKYAAQLEDYKRDHPEDPDGRHFVYQEELYQIP